MRNNIRPTREILRWLVIYSHVLIVTCVVLIVNCMLCQWHPSPLPCVSVDLGSSNINSVYASATDGLVFN